jgi:DnaJ like chaperone protein
MQFAGKIIGAFFGYLLFGPVGFLLGLFIGHYFDRGLHLTLKTPFSHQFQARQTIQKTFFDATFSIMGYIAKADGRVSEAEIRLAQHVMRQMNLNHTMRLHAIALFNRGKQASFNLDQVLHELREVCGNQINLLSMFIEIQLQIANADGHLSPKQQQLLQHICQRLGFTAFDFRGFSNRYRAEQNYQRQQHYQYQSRQTPPPSLLENAYKILGIARTATDAEIKKAYRRLMSQHHPDKLISKGLPEEMLKLATQKTQEIKEAYEQICKARGIK